VTRYVETDLHSTSDDFLGPEAVPSNSANQELFTRGTAHLVSFDGKFEQTAGFAYTDYHRLFLDPNAMSTSPTIYRGDRTKYDWQGNIKVVPGQIVTIGAEHQLDEINDSTPVRAHMTNDAGFVTLQSSLGDRLFNATSLRYDDNGRFGSKPTFRVAPAILIPETDSKLKGSVGTGFKAPTLDELFDNFPAFGFFANPNLKPETSLGYDFGFDQSVLDNRVQFGSTYFHNDINNLITINDTGTTYVNVGRAETYGAESFVAWQPRDSIKLRVDYTYTIAEDLDAHTELLRRPKSKFSGNAAWQVTEQAQVSTTVLYIGSRMDINRDGTATGLSNSAYTLVNLAGSYELGHGITAFARVDNLLDRHYQDPIGFQRPGIGAFAGLRIAFEPLEVIR